MNLFEFIPEKNVKKLRRVVSACLLGAAALVAVIAVRGIVVFAFVIGLVFADDGSAALAGSEVPVIAGPAKGCVIGSHVVPVPDTVSTMGTDHSVFFQTVEAVEGVIKPNTLVLIQDSSASFAGFCFIHTFFLLKTSKGPGVVPRGLLGYHYYGIYMQSLRIRKLYPFVE